MSNRKNKAQNRPKSTKGTKNVKARTKNPAPQNRVARSLAPANIEEVCTQLDAFCNVPAKIPDESASRSLVYMQRWAYTMSTDANGNASIWAPSPHPYLQQLNTTTIASDGTATLVAGSYTALSAIPGAWQYRIVKAGFQVTEIGNKWQQQGVTRICVPNSPEVTSLAVYDINGYNYDKIYMETYGKRSIVQVPFIRFAAARPEQWYNTGSPYTNKGTANNFSFYPIIISVIGAQVSAPVLRVEFFCTYELNFNDDNSLSMLTTPAPIYRPVMAGIIKGVESTLSEFVHTGAEGFKNYLKRAAIRAIQARFAPSTLALTVD